MLPSRSKKSSKSISPEAPTAHEIWGLLVFFAALFWIFSAFFPQASGAIGEWLVQKLGRSMLGVGIFFLPILIGLTSAILFMSLLPKKRLKALWGLLIFGLSGLVLLQWILSDPTLGGGFVGSLLFGLAYRIGGFWGTLLLLVLGFLLSSIIVFNFSLKALIKKLVNRPPQKMPPVKSSEPKPAHIPPFEQELETFPDTLEEIEPSPTPRFEPSEVYSHSQNYSLPSLDLLEPPKLPEKSKLKTSQYQERARLLEETLKSFHVEAKVVHITPGPSVTRYELQPGIGVKISKITALSKDIALKLAAVDVRIEAPIPGKALVGIEVPNPKIDMVNMRMIIEKTDFYERTSKLLCTMGLTITGDPIVMDLASMPHILIAGATGSGKSVCVNSIILSILMRATPDDVKFLMIDPKKVELSLYEDIPHLLAPVVTNPHKAAATLQKWALVEMERRYEEFSKVGVKHIEGYNARVEKMTSLAEDTSDQGELRLDQFLFPEGRQTESSFVPQKLPYIVVIIDELADLMMVASQEVENTICRLAQMSRATGIHLVIATQRPSVDVVTGLIKANVPSRISFFLQSQIDSRTILDTPGAEKLLGKGDMLYMPVGAPKPMRVQGVFVSEKEISQIVSVIKTQGKPNYLTEIMDVEPLSETTSAEEGLDELFEEAKQIVVSTQYASTSYLQRKLRIGYNRAARLMEDLQKRGIVPENPDRKRLEK